MVILHDGAGGLKVTVKYDSKIKGCQDEASGCEVTV